MSNESSVVHSTFSIERAYAATPSRVFFAFADQQTKRRWFAEGEGWEIHEFTADFEVGGYERSWFSFRGGAEIRNVTRPSASNCGDTIAGPPRPPPRPPGAGAG